jgi:hypothetical protein
LDYLINLEYDTEAVFGRKSYSWAQKEYKPKNYRHFVTERYRLLNFQNEYTVEFRGFLSTDDRSTLKKYLEFVIWCTEYVKGKTFETSFLEYNFQKGIQKFYY